MGHECQSLCLGKAGRLLWLTGILFVVIIAFQFIELPYDNVLLSLFSGGKVPVAQESSSVTLSIEDIVQKANNVPTSKNARETAKNFTQKSDGMHGDSSEVIIKSNNTASRIRRSLDESASSPLALLPIGLSPNITLPVTNTSSPVMSVYSTRSSVEKDVTPTFHQMEKSGQLQSNISTSDDNSSVKQVLKEKKEPERPTSAVVSLAEMYLMLLQSRPSYRSMRPRWSSAVDQELLYVRSQIESSPVLKNDRQLYAPLYRNVSMFKRLSYINDPFLSHQIMSHLHVEKSTNMTFDTLLPLRILLCSSKLHNNCRRLEASYLQIIYVVLFKFK